MHSALRCWLQGHRSTHCHLQSAAKVGTASRIESVLYGSTGTGHQAVHSLSAGRDDTTEASPNEDAASNGASANECRLGEVCGLASGVGQKTGNLFGTWRAYGHVPGAKSHIECGRRVSDGDHRERYIRPRRILD